MIPTATSLSTTRALQGTTAPSSGAETHLLKAELVTRIQGVITAQNLTQTAAAKRMGLSQPDVSRLLNGQFRDVSVERLMRLLTRLGCDIDITIRSHGKAAAPRDTIRLQATAS